MVELLQQISSSAQGLVYTVQEWKDQLKSQPNSLDDPDGISLLTLKNHFMLDYLHSLTTLTLLKLRGKPFEESSECIDIINNLVYLRVAMEKIQPLEKKLSYQMDKVLRRVEEFERRKNNRADDEEDENESENENLADIANDPLSFKPNVANLTSTRQQRATRRRDNDNEDDEEITSEDEKTAKSKTKTTKTKTKDDKNNEKKKEDKAGIYRPPRIAPVSYPEIGTGAAAADDDDGDDDKPGNTKKIRKDSRRDRKNTQVLAEMAADITGGNTPYEETATGLSNPIGIASKRHNRRTDELDRFEEENMTRMFMGKKDARNRRRDEEDAAFGRRRNEDVRKGRRSVGFEAEIGDVLGAISTSTQHDDHHDINQKNINNNNNNDAYKNVRGFKRKGPHFDKDDSIQTSLNSKSHRKGEFEKALSKEGRKKRRQ